MSDKARCLRMADECERMAKRIVDATDRATLLNMAKIWRELADTAVTAEWIADVSTAMPRPRKLS